MVIFVVKSEAESRPIRALARILPSKRREVEETIGREDMIWAAEDVRYDQQLSQMFQKPLHSSKHLPTVAGVRVVDLATLLQEDAEAGLLAARVMGRDIVSALVIVLDGRHFLVRGDVVVVIEV